MKCQVCGAQSETLFQVVQPTMKDVDTSTFSYGLLCGACVDKQGLRRSVIREQKPAKEKR